MGPQKRIQIFELIIGVALIIFSIKDVFSLMEYIFDYPSQLLACAAGLITGIIILVECDNIILKTAFIVFAAFTVYVSTGISMIKVYFNEEYAFFRSSLSLIDSLASLCSAVTTAIAAVVALMTMNKSIIWKSRESLLKYTYIMAGLHILCSFNRMCSVELIFFVYLFLPCFKQKEVSYKSILGLTGEVAFASALIIPLICSLIVDRDETIWRILVSGTFSLEGFIINSTHSPLSDILGWSCMILLALSPLMVFDRQCVIEKNADYDDKDPDDFHIRLNDNEN
jgi:hypothetical protein